MLGVEFEPWSWSEGLESLIDGDINGDGAVILGDLFILKRDWGKKIDWAE